MTDQGNARQLDFADTYREYEEQFRFDPID